MKQHPILYSFRRCPYAMRARLAISNSQISVELREVVLRDKPQQLLDISAKATVPVLLLTDGSVIDESIDIMRWALAQNDNSQWLPLDLSEDINQLIQTNDDEFKYYLDRYKYADRYPEQPEIFYRKKAEYFLMALESRLKQHSFLCGEQLTLADVAIFPFIRQFSNVDMEWFQSSDYLLLQQWLQKQVKSNLFASIMYKYPAWKKKDSTIFFPSQNQLKAG